MKIEIKIELDKDSQELIQTTLNKVAENLVGFVNMFEKFTIKTENVVAKKDDISAEKQTKKTESGSTKDSINVATKPESKQPEPAKTTKKSTVTKSKVSKTTANSKNKKTSLEIVLNTIKKRGGINVEDLKKETGFTARKVADAVYRLKKTGKIDKTDEGLYVPIG
ncbi:MAG: hypothetical protein HQK73_08750 [Desulfamplus sp.]|nr:hypothetical protein [Desulfamplus sp.]